MLYRTLRPLLFRLDPERAHGLGMAAAQRVPASVVAPVFGYEDERLAQTLWGLRFPNPVGLAAGFDKNAEGVGFWGDGLGFGFAEVGSVSAQAAAGNPKPRAFRLVEDRALVNRMGLNNHGALTVTRRLREVHTTRPLGVNLAKTHDATLLGEAGVEDFRQSFRLLAPLAGFVVLNVSCPNTKEGKTFEAPDALDALLTAIAEERAALAGAPPVLVKLSPPPADGVDLGALHETVAVCRMHGIDGFVATNTASDRKGVTTPTQRLEAIGRGGLSGEPLQVRSTTFVRALYRETDSTLPIVGVGGVDGAEAAYAKIRAGASLVELYTALVYEGPGVVRQIKEGLVALLERDGFTHLSQAVGIDV